jgi:putative ABC transport system permease protein
MNAVAHILSAALRPLGRNPGFGLTVVVTLALGIAPNCVIFAIMDAVYFRPLPYPDQERMVLVNVASKRDATLTGVDGYTFGEWRARATSFDRLAAYRNAGFNLRVGDRADRLTGQVVTSDFFSVVRVAPALGRAIAEADCAPGAPAVLVISDRAWREVFDRRADIVNLPIRLNGNPATVVGVMPPGFTSFMEGRTAGAWAPLPPEPRSGPGGTTSNVIGRLKPGATIAQATAELSAAQSSIAASASEQMRDRTVVARDFQSALFIGLGPALRMLMVIVGLLLLIACANAANLLLGRAAGRTREVAIRTALGAGRPRLVAGQLAESLTLSMAAAACGLLLAFWGTRLVWAGAAPIFTRIGVEGFPFDSRIVVFASGLTSVVVMLFALGPALRGSRGDTAGVLKTGLAGSGHDRRAGRMSRCLVVGQAALCVVTLVVTALMIRSVVHFSHLSASPGFDPTVLVVATLPGPEQGAAADATARAAVVRQIEERLCAVPGVEMVALTNRLPFLESGTPAVVARGGAGAGRESASRVDADVRVVNAAYFETFGVRVLKGRLLTAQDDRTGAPVAVIDERLASTWGAAVPVGDQVTIDGTPRTIVGIVTAETEPSPFRPAPRGVFLPYGQVPSAETTLVVRSRLAADAVTSAVRSSVAAIDPDQPLTELRPLSRALDEFMTPFRLILSLVALFGATALGLAALGLYSVMARGVSRRTREIGIRMAMGAGQREIVGMVMREGLRPAAAGLVLGLLLGLAIARILPSGILGVSGLAGWHYLAAVLVWLAAAAGACFLPARRAASVEPVRALRCE